MKAEEPDRELQWLRRLRDAAARLAEDDDPQRVVTAILDGAIELCAAERGFLVRVEGEDGLRIVVARGFDQVGLSGVDGAVSRTVVERVLEREAGLVTTDAEDAHLLQVSSVRDRRVRAIACVPLRVRGRTLGVLYVDHRFDQAAFTAQELPWLRAFADQAAVALETSELRGGACPPPEQVRACADVAALRAGGGGAGLPGFVGSSPALIAAFEGILRAARGDAPVLLRAEAGLEDEATARAIHSHSARATAPFLSAVCLEDPEAAAAELFGRRRGAGGAERRGLLNLAGQGSLYLRGAEALPLEVQGALLRVLEERQATPVGGRRAEPVACRLIVGVSGDLRARVAAGAFREDLYYRLDVLRVDVPPLRQRAGDLPALIASTLARLGVSLRLSEPAERLLQDYPWPGNLQELENELLRLVSLGVPKVARAHLSPELQASADAPPGGKTLPEVEQAMVAEALRAARGNKAQAARQLGIPRTSLYALIQRYGLD